MRYTAVEEARRLGLETVTFAEFDVSEETYSPGGAGYGSVLQHLVKRSPGALVLLGCPPNDTPRIVQDAREMGYKGLITSHNSQELALLRQVAGKHAEGFIMMVGAGASGGRSEYMNDFMRLYKERTGVWHESAGTKVYALEVILATLQKAGKEAIVDTRLFKQAMESFEIDDPFVNRPRKLRYVGTVDFKQRRQVGVPLVLGEVRREGIFPVFTGGIE
jgi:branched-chain amino acid transport system substrate-binding protein